MRYIIFILVLFLSGCESIHHVDEGTADAVYWHENDWYTLKTIEPDGSVKDYNIPMCNDCQITVTLWIDDLKGGKPTYRCIWDENRWIPPTGHCDIHIHRLSDLGTADWNHGKFGSGPTTRIN